MNGSTERKLTTNVHFFAAALFQTRVYAWQPGFSVEHGVIERIGHDYIALRNETGDLTFYQREQTIFVNK
ncbi:hypothetical protein [Paenibacillus hunanensis]|uniref:Uncharacterized protein n=1 Tax=Paenibacillus hunanensis TaxID=539262 RepID=A0ABU1IWX8_9BACL|nr:hypothetical protein [Paenibacillus hunanensis]MCL9661189.1 hypothetical protein [Paenibacillus hunanensis]MDR6243761.1 hypothetical protein [Paenibacillus hunanensis]WPP42338.1 hypothetical protein SK066_05130 [Paenibacillus hunanensis]GGJ24559.1 hypothetical protein GCM10008022_36910 [Paenibacillus hunanensis]